MNRRMVVLYVIQHSRQNMFCNSVPSAQRNTREQAQMEVQHLWQMLLWSFNCGWSVLLQKSHEWLVNTVVEMLRPSVENLLPGTTILLQDCSLLMTLWMKISASCTLMVTGIVPLHACCSDRLTTGITWDDCEVRKMRQHFLRALVRSFSLMCM